MKSTGEVMGIDRDFGAAFFKSQIAAGSRLPRAGRVFLSVRDADKPALVEIARRLAALGFELIATRGTRDFLSQHGLTVTLVNKAHEGRPHIVDRLKDRDIALVINTTEGRQAVRDSFALRRTALMSQIPYYTTIAGARAVVRALERLRAGDVEVQPLQSYVSDLESLLRHPA